MISYKKALFCGFLAALILSVGPTQGFAAELKPLQPAYWPSSVDVAPQIEGWPNALRIFGSNRYETNLSLALMLRGGGQFPYQISKQPESGGSDLPSTSHWWGLETCPNAVIIVASDSPADALAASSLSDPSGLSTEPFLRRTASADPLFDPVGGYARVDTNQAPIFLTGSARSGVASLSLPAVVGLRDLRQGGCRTAREAIIVGGPAAVPVEVEAQLLGLGYDSVYRIQGANRFGTAARVALSIGTSSIPIGISSCVDQGGADGTLRMGFYANAAIEWRESATQCEILPRTVVIADGITGADALAASWWTSYWQVPVLLHNGSDQITPDTSAALQTMNIQNVVILGGEKRISNAAAQSIGDSTGARVRRVAGNNRYETSVKMAEIFGGWWATGRGSDFSSGMLCFAASSGLGRSAKGWPDALAAGAWCGAASAGSARLSPPSRALPPANGSHPILATESDVRKRDAVPILLVPAGVERLPKAVEAFLRRVFPPSNVWCSSNEPFTGCYMPGFAVIFGGPSIVTSTAVGKISAGVNGQVVTASKQSEPQIADMYATKLSMAPIFQQQAVVGTQFCFPRASYYDARWLTITKSGEKWPSVVRDAMSEGWYLPLEGISLVKAREGSPVCLLLPPHEGKVQDYEVRTIGVDGIASPPRIVDLNSSSIVDLSRSVSANPASSYSGPDFVSHPHLRGTAAWLFESISPPTTITIGGTLAALRKASLELTMTQDLASQADRVQRFTATWTLDTPLGELIGTADGEAVLVQGVWKMRGRSSFTRGNWPLSGTEGGFQADIYTNDPGLADDAVEWRVDLNH